MKTTLSLHSKGKLYNPLKSHTRPCKRGLANKCSECKSEDFIRRISILKIGMPRNAPIPSVRSSHSASFHEKLFRARTSAIVLAVARQNLILRNSEVRDIDQVFDCGWEGRALIVLCARLFELAVVSDVLLGMDQRVYRRKQMKHSSAFTFEKSLSNTAVNSVVFQKHRESRPSMRIATNAVFSDSMDSGRGLPFCQKCEPPGLASHECGGQLHVQQRKLGCQKKGFVDGPAQPSEFEDVLNRDV
ncbi:hypothetical protein BJ741DRAFT_600898 [Chytriomyces cf. hyalinus JEL632]|nr:hypothetical protein BJ741DRAFT_600898 [Chytriomyces cf. hyalinus JEL632]